MSCDEPFHIRRGDTLPIFQADAKVEGKPFLFATGGWTVITFEMSGPVLVTGAATGDDTGLLTYAWIAGDTATPGTYEAVFRGTALDGNHQTFPTSGSITVIIDP